MREEVEKVNMEKVIEEFERITRDAENVQRETLKKILEKNAWAEYLQSLGLNGKTNIESFKACVPLVIYKDLEPYIQRMVDGNISPILTGKPITTMSTRYLFKIYFLVRILKSLKYFNFEKSVVLLHIALSML